MKPGSFSPPATRPTSRLREVVLAPHLARLSGDWALWRTVCLRGAGFPVCMLADLGAPALASAADTVNSGTVNSGTVNPGTVNPGTINPGTVHLGAARAAYAAEFAAEARRLSSVLYQMAGLPLLREAIAWQNRHALETGIDVLLRHGPGTGKRNAQRRRHEALVASYLQRYCAKNDTIGFFGPVGWSWIDDEAGVRVTPAAPGKMIAARVTYLEGWAVRAILARHDAALRPWLVPRRVPFISVDGMLLRLPLGLPRPLAAAEAALLRACDGIRDATEVCAAVLADTASGMDDAAQVFALMGRLTDSHRLAWQIDVAPQDIRPERSVRTLLARVTDDALREPAEGALAELTAARDEVAAAAGDADRVAAAMAGLEETFTRLSGAPATRRAGLAYAGRTLIYEECLRGDTVRLGTDTLDGIREALGLVLDSARWFTIACGAEYVRHFEAVYRQRAGELGTDVVPFADWWMLENDALSQERPPFIEPVVRELGQRWAMLLELPPDARRIQLRAADLRERVAAAFPAGPVPWPLAVHHSPDLMIAEARPAASGPLTWVLGEVHPGLMTSRYATWLEFHDAPAAVHAAIRHDLNGPAVWMAETETVEQTGTCIRLAAVPPRPGDLRLMYAHDSCGYDPAATLVIGDCDLISTPSGLRVRRRDGTLERSLLEVAGDLISTLTASSFDLMPPAAHAPRVTIDDLVVSREKWTLPVTEPAFAGSTDESARYLQARAWAARHGLPRHVFLRFTGERKPIYADLTSLASIDLLCRGLRRARRNARQDATVAITEMLPAPDQAWLSDAHGQRYTAELRMVATDIRQERLTALEPGATRRRQGEPGAMCRTAPDTLGQKNLPERNSVPLDRRQRNVENFHDQVVLRD
ncbi:MAG TPA: lantibiotic dehydratase [Streptosporangiaceae bacterium]